MKLDCTFRWWMWAAALVMSVGAPLSSPAQTTDEAVRQAVASGSSARVIMQFNSTAARDAALTRLLDRGAAVRATGTEAGPALVVLGSASALGSEFQHAAHVSLDATVAAVSVTPAHAQRGTNRESTEDSRDRGDSRDGESRDGESRDGESRDGESRDGESRDGESRDGESRDGESRDRDSLSVAIIDSGIAPHVDLPAWRIRKFKDFVNGVRTPIDTCGHGTHVAGIVAGSGRASAGQNAGVDADVDIVVLRVLGDDCSGRTSDVIDALEWVARNHETHKIKVVNLSLGHPVFESIFTDPLVQAVERLSRKGILVVTAAGNLGILPRAPNPTGLGLGTMVMGAVGILGLDPGVDVLPGYGGVIVPCNAPSSMCVGSLDTKGTDSFEDDSVAKTSSRGPTRFNLLAKPDILAAGVRIASISAPGSTLFTEHPELQVFGSDQAPGTPAAYLTLSGTSMASPRVAGAAALIFKANRKLSANTAKLVLQFTARVLNSADVLTQGAGVLNLSGALDLARSINPSARKGKNWLRSTTGLPSNLDSNGTLIHWGQRIIYGDRFVPAGYAGVHLVRWDDDLVWGYDAFADNIVWGNDDDNIVWGNDDNIVWGNDDNIVWGNDDNIVWGNSADDNIVWGNDDNIVWGNDDVVRVDWAANILWGFWDDNIVWGNITRDTFDNIVWGNDDDNIVWGNCSDAANVVLGLDDNIVWGNCGDNIVWGNSVLTGGGQ